MNIDYSDHISCPLRQIMILLYLRTRSWKYIWMDIGKILTCQNFSKTIWLIIVISPSPLSSFIARRNISFYGTKTCKLEALFYRQRRRIHVVIRSSWHGLLLLWMLVIIWPRDAWRQSAKSSFVRCHKRHSASHADLNKVVKENNESQQDVGCT